MATLVLTVAGTIVGGPIGAAIGAVIGQQIDQGLFAPKGRRGPRLGDLSVQVSRYGQPLPKLFGTMRVAGTVIWATDLIESTHRSGGGKGKPKTTTYSYSASFVVALSSRPIRSVGRIWADGKLLRGAAGDWKAHTQFRLYTGHEDQPVDPLLAAAEGIGNSPAYRGLAYVVFEGLELADFANHIPSMTFEVEADAVPVALDFIADALSDGLIAGSSAMAVSGFAALGDSVRGAIEPLSSAAGLSFGDDGTALRIATGAGAPLVVGAGGLGASADGKRKQRIESDRIASGALPDEIAIEYYEPSRDYQTGLQRARRGGPARRAEQTDLAAALTADSAKSIAEARLARAWAERERRTVRLPWFALDLTPGMHVALAGVPGRWRVSEARFEQMVVELKLVGVALESGAMPLDAAPGRAIAAADDVHGPTTLHLLDLPPLTDEPLTAPRLWIAAAGISAGWRRAALAMSSDGGLSYTDFGATAAPATMGIAASVLADGTSLLFDDRGRVDIELLNDAMTLTGRSDDALVDGANLAVLGGELLQFGRAEQIGPRRFQLSRLLRGRRGSEDKMTGHGIGERFVLIEAGTLVAFDLPLASLGASVSVFAAGVGDSAGVEAVALSEGRALRPPSPVNVSAERLADGALHVRWTRRSRIGWNWADGGDVLLGEEAERYRVHIIPSSGLPRTADVSTPHFEYSLSDQIADESLSAASVVINVIQSGSLARSLPASIIFDV